MGLYNSINGVSSVLITGKESQLWINWLAGEATISIFNLEIHQQNVGYYGIFTDD